MRARVRQNFKYCNEMMQEKLSGNKKQRKPFPTCKAWEDHCSCKHQSTIIRGSLSRALRLALTQIGIGRVFLSVLTIPRTFGKCKILACFYSKKASHLTRIVRRRLPYLCSTRRREPIGSANTILDYTASTPVLNIIPDLIPSSLGRLGRRGWRNKSSTLANLVRRAMLWLVATSRQPSPPGTTSARCWC